jgi:hypothetical protein
MQIILIIICLLTAINCKIEEFYFSVITLASGTNTAYVVLPQAIIEHIYFCESLYLGKNMQVFDLIHLRYVRD